MGLRARPLPGACCAAARQGVLSSALAAFAVSALFANTGVSPLADDHRVARGASAAKKQRTQKTEGTPRKPKMSLLFASLVSLASFASFCNLFHARSSLTTRAGST